MICENCKSSISYGTKYCTVCGEKIPNELNIAEYEKTIWAKLDRAKDKYDTMLLKKLTGNVVFKAVWLIVVLGYFFFTMYGNLNGIRIKDSETYKVQYNEQAEEYYIIPLKQEASLELFVPVGTEDIEFTAVSNGKENDSRRFTTKQYKEQGYTVTADKYDAIYINAIRKGKSADKIKVIVTSK